MSSFEQALDVVLKHEGGLADNPNDPGGITNYGISLRYVQTELADARDEHGDLFMDLDHDGKVDATDIRLLTPEIAGVIYRSRWWDRFGYAQLSDQQAATKVFDMAVNMGAKRAHILLQQALRDCGYANFPVTGFLGPMTVKAVNESESRELLLATCRQQELFYQGLAHSQPKLAEFLPGWTIRAAWPFRPGAYLGGGGLK